MIRNKLEKKYRRQELLYRGFLYVGLMATVAVIVFFIYRDVRRRA